MTYPDGEVVSYGYLAQMMINSVGGSATYVQSTQYNAAGRVELRSLGGNQLRTDYQYQPWNTQGGRLVWLKSGSNAANDNLQRFEYSYDANGNVAWIKDYLAGGTQTQSFGYDALDRLTTASASAGSGGLYSQSYSYDSYGRLLNGPLGSSYSYGDSAYKHAVTSVGSNSFGYDLTGNMTTRTISGNSYTQSYDAENRLVSVAGAATASFVYDGDNNRVRGTVGGVTTVYIGTIYEMQGSTIKKYYYAGNQRVAMRENGNLSWLLGDHLGSTAYTVNGTTETGEARYFPWGKDRFTSGTTPTSYKFTGQRQEASLGLYDYGARWYDPALGRFVGCPLGADTIVPGGPLGAGDVQSFDRYAYVNNNPLKYVDPTGHQATCTMDAQNNVQCSDNAVTGGQTLTVDLADEPRSFNPDGTGFFMTMGGLFIGAFAAPFVAPYVAALLPSACADGDCTNEVTAVTAACADGDCTNEVTAVQRAVDSGLNAIRNGVGRGYNTFNSFKYHEGPAGAGQAWHHIVGQTASNVAQFGAQAINNTNNLIRLPHGAGTIHQQVTSFYNSIQPDITGSNTLRVYEWLATRSFEEQWKFGVDLINRFGGQQYIIQQFGR